MMIYNANTKLKKIDCYKYIYYYVKKNTIYRKDYQQHNSYLKMKRVEAIFMEPMITINI